VDLSHLVLPSQLSILAGWSTYGLDFKKLELYVMDPSMPASGYEQRMTGHKTVSSLIIYAASACMQRATGDTTVGIGRWRKIMLLPSNSVTKWYRN
jgi:hypothetical protein